MSEILANPTLLMFYSFLAISLAAMFVSDHHHKFMLISFTVLLFGLPRAGVFLSFVNLPLPVSYILATVFVASWLLFRSWRRRERSRLNFVFLIFMTVGIFSLAWGLGNGGASKTAIIETWFYVFAVGIFFWATDNYAHRESFVTFSKVILVISLLVSLYAIAQRFVSFDILVNSITYNSSSDTPRRLATTANMGIRRVISTYGDPNVLASQMVIFFGMALAILLLRGSSFQMKMIAAVLLVLNVLAVVYTGSRTALVCLALVSIVVMSFRNRWILLLLPALAIGSIVFLPEIVEMGLAGRFSGLLDASDMRAQFPRMAWQLVNIVPVGAGFGRSVVLSTERLTWAFNIVSADVVWQSMNSLWLDLFCRLGIPGMLTFLALMVGIFRFVVVRCRRIPDSWYKSVMLGGVAGLVGQWIMWGANNTYMLPGGTLNLWFMLGMLVAGARAFSTQPVIVMVPVSQSWYDSQMAAMRRWAGQYWPSGGVTATSAENGAGQVRI